MEEKFYKQCWFWLMLIFILLLVAFITFGCSCWPCFTRIFCSVDILSALASLATIGALLWSVHIFHDEKEREIKRATLAAFPPIRKKYFEFQLELQNLDEPDKNIRLKEYLSDMERFASVVNDGAYDIKIINKMSGGMLVSQYEKHLKDIIQKKRIENTSDYIESSSIYCEYEKMIEDIRKLRKENK